jgi:hypothetical protein
MPSKCLINMFYEVVGKLTYDVVGGTVYQNTFEGWS